MANALPMPVQRRLSLQILQLMVRFLDQILRRSVQLAEATGKNVIASGGVSNLADLKAIAARGISGAIVGKALYENRFYATGSFERGGEHHVNKTDYSLP